MDSETRKINIIRARQSNPCATLQEIGTRYGVTRERVRQVLSEAEKPTGAYHQTYLCIQCGKDIGTEKKLFCNQQCQHNHRYIEIACICCGTLKEYNVKYLVWQIEHSRHSSNLFFCSKFCNGKWLAENHGFITHPKSIGRKRVWDYSKVYELRDETGWGTVKISRALGIPESTISDILRRRKCFALNVKQK